MSRTRVVAASALSFALLWALLMLVFVDREPPTLNVITAISETTTTLPDFEALVQTEVVGGELGPEEEELTEEVLETTTTSTTTTTAPKKSSPPSGGSSPGPTPTTTAPAGSSAGYLASAENDFAGRINSHRSANGLGSLTRSGSLDSHARSWAKHMAQQGSLSHSNIGSLLGSWSAVAENVGTGGSVSGIFGALVNSSGHNANMLGDYSHFGIGVYRDSTGRLWTAHVFAR